MGAVDPSKGTGHVYIVFLNTLGTVLNYTTIGSNIGGHPELDLFTSFGSSITRIGDLDHDNVTDIAVGSMDYDEVGSLNSNSGATYVCFMHSNGTVKRSVKISEYAELPSRGEDDGIFPLTVCVALNSCMCPQTLCCCTTTICWR